MWSPLNRSGAEERTLELLLRIGVAGCFIGHGAFGVIGKVGWLPYFSVVGIGEDLAWTLMPIVGTIDIVIGIAALLSPRPLVLAYAVVWALWTAMLRPLAGESPFETLERAGNYGVPLALLLLAGGLDWGKAWLRTLVIDPFTPERRALVALALRVTTVALLVGHGALALGGKSLLVDHVAGVGLPASSLGVLGAVEIALALAIAVRPMPGVLLFVLGWKLGTEALFPITGAPFWEFVERAGSYVAPLALWTMIRGASPDAARARVSGRHVAKLSAVALLLLAASALGTAESKALSTASAPDTTLLGRLQTGGYVLACRHAITDRSRGDADRVDYDDPSTQRVLSAAGREQARLLGRELRSLGIPVGEVLTSPFARTRESAELAFGRSHRSDALLYGDSREQRDARRRLLTDPPLDGSNRVLMTHQGVLYGMMPDVPRGSIREGDCVVVAPAGAEGFEVVRRLAPDQWVELAAGRESLGPPPPVAALGGSVRAAADLKNASITAAVESTQDASTQAAIEAARAGGTTLVCRHAITTSFQEREPVDYDDPGTQRLLSEEGEAQSRELGRDMRRLGIVVTELIASPMHRAQRTADLMFDLPLTIDASWHTNGGSYDGPPRDRRLRMLATPVAEGNRLIVSHIGTISSVIPEARDHMEEGDCAVVRAGDGGHTLVGLVPWRAWEAGAPDPAARLSGTELAALRLILVTGV